MRRLPAVLSVLALAATAGAAAASTAPEYAEQRTYFHCASTKVGNAGAVTGGLPSWNTTAPTASVQSGAGCGSTNSPVLTTTGHQGLLDTVFTGTFTGNIRDMTLELHSIYASTARAGVGSFGVRVEVLVDGVRYAPTATTIDVTPVPSSTRASEKATLTLTGFNLTEDLDGNGVADAGPGTTKRTISVKLRNGYSDQPGAFVYDTVEVPSGITFNPAKRETAVAPVAKG